MKVMFFVLFFVFLFSNIQGQELKVKPGFWSPRYFQDDNQLTKKEFENVLEKNNTALELWTKSKRQVNLWWTFAGVEGGFAVWFLSVNGNADKMLAPAIGMVSSFAIGSVFFFKSINSGKKAIRTYNERFDSRTAFKLVPTSNQNGLGLALKF